MSEQDLVSGYDSSAPNQAFGIREYLDELHRRRTDAQTQTMVRLTWAIAAMTAVNVAAVIVALFIE